MKVLVIDDNPVLTKPIEIIIKHKGHDCQVCHNGREALRLIETQNWDRILLDLVLPGVSGLELIDKIEANNQLKQKVIIFTATSFTEGQINEMNKKGIHTVLRKPCNVEQILKALDLV